MSSTRRTDTEEDDVSTQLDHAEPVDAEGRDTEGRDAEGRVADPVDPDHVARVERSDDAPADDAAAERRGPGRVSRGLSWLRGHVAAVVAALLVVALVVALALTTLALRHEKALDDARTSALQAGKESAVALSSYDYRTLDKDFGAVTSRSTPTFRDSFNQTSASLRKVLEQYDATATSTIVAAGVTSATEHRAVVLVFLDQKATNTNQTAGPTTDQSRIEVTLARSGSRWLIDGVKLL